MGDNFKKYLEESKVGNRTNKCRSIKLVKNTSYGNCFHMLVNSHMEYIFYGGFEKSIFHFVNHSRKLNHVFDTILAEILSSVYTIGARKREYLSL